MAKKPSMGRQKIEMTKIKKKNHLQVTFSKRRSGLFKKASELCTLCGVEIAILVFSPAGKAFSFGHPSVESIIGRFFTRNPSPDSSELNLVEAHRSATVRELNLQLTQVLNQLEAEKKHGEILSQIRETTQSQCWWEKPINEMVLHEVQQLRASLEELKKSVAIQVDKLSIQAANPSAIFMNQFIGNVDHLDRKPSEYNASSSTVPHGYNFGFGSGFF